MNKEARARFLRFAESEQAIWQANFRDLNAAITRMATLSAGGRIHVELVDEEIQRLRQQWQSSHQSEVSSSLSELDGILSVQDMDRFDQIALAEVVRVCRGSSSLSVAGRKLFAVSRLSKAKPNDADRLRKYLARFGLSWDQVTT